MSDMITPPPALTAHAGRTATRPSTWPLVVAIVALIASSGLGLAVGAFWLGSPTDPDAMFLAVILAVAGAIPGLLLGAVSAATLIIGVRRRERSLILVSAAALLCLVPLAAVLGMAAPVLLR